MSRQNPSLLEIIINPSIHDGKPVYVRGSLVGVWADGFVLEVEKMQVRVISRETYSYDQEIMVSGKVDKSGAIHAEHTKLVEHYRYKSLAHYLLIIVVAILLIREFRLAYRIERWQMY